MFMYNAGLRLSKNNITINPTVHTLDAKGNIPRRLNSDSAYGIPKVKQSNNRTDFILVIFHKYIHIKRQVSCTNPKISTI
jgi:hypothetical protein